MAIEHTLYCDKCGSIIDASRKSAADARTDATIAKVYVRCGKLDLCRVCFDESQKAVETGAVE